MNIYRTKHAKYLFQDIYYCEKRETYNNVEKGLSELESQTIDLKGE